MMPKTCNGSFDIELRCLGGYKLPWRVAALLYNPMFPLIVGSVAGPRNHDDPWGFNKISSAYQVVDVIFDAN